MQGNRCFLFGRFLDGVDHLQGIQRVFARAARNGFAALAQVNEVIELGRHRVVLLHLEVLVLDGIQPTVCVIVLVVQVHVREAERALRAEDAHAVLAGAHGEEGVLLRRKVVIPGAWRAVGNEVAGRYAALVFHHRRNGILHLVAADGVAGRRVHLRGLHAGDEVQVVEVVDGVDQKRARALLRVPFHIEVLMRLGDGVVGLDAHDLPQLARVDDLTKKLIAAGRAAMMPHQKRCACVLADLDDVLGVFHGVRDGLLKQDVLDARCQRKLNGRNMQVVGKRDGYRIQVFLLKEQRVVVVQANTQLLGNCHVMVAEAGNRNQVDFRIGLRIARNLRALVQAEYCHLDRIH